MPSDSVAGPDRHDARPACGTRIGRYVALRDIDGCLYAVSPGAVAVVCETDDGTLLMLPGGRMIQVPRAIGTVLTWLDGRG